MRFFNDNPIRIQQYVDIGSFRMFTHGVICVFRQRMSCDQIFVDLEVSLCYQSSEYDGLMDIFQTIWGLMNLEGGGRKIFNFQFLINFDYQTLTKITEEKK